jgi:basic amino acid/polyamine antiporter, APA family
VTLRRSIGRLALTGLVINAVLGSSVFGLPSSIGGRLGAASPWAWVLAALGMALVVACFAEVASRFEGAGGQYLYVRATFGRLAGIEMAWLSYLVRLTASATNANLFVIYLAEFVPGVEGRVAASLVLALILLPLVVANVRGVGSGLGVSSFFTVAKMVPLALFIVLGLALLPLEPAVRPPSPAPVPGDWLHVILLLVFAYGGFEAALMPLGEARDPRRDAPVALFTAFGLIALIYTLVQVVVILALPDPGSSSRPLADAARVFLGRGGAVLLALGALISVYGYLAGAMLNVPRLTYAMAEQGDLPPQLGAVHPRFQTPHRSVILFGVLVWAWASLGSFLSNLSLSAVSRLLGYGAMCVALVVLRRREASGDAGVMPAWFTVPAGTLVAALGLGFTAILALRMTGRELVVLVVTLALGLLHWWWARRTPVGRTSRRGGG